MWAFQERDDDNDLLTFALGAAGGLALGMLLAQQGTERRVRELGTGLGTRARSLGRRFSPGRLRREAREVAGLTRLEDAVIDALLADTVLSARGIDVGAVSSGIIELSGSVWTEEEADRAVRVASGVDGVRTVINRMDLEDELDRVRDLRRRYDNEEDSLTEANWQGRNVGMGRRRQGEETDPDRPDDSQVQRTTALRNADLDEYETENLANRSPEEGVRPEVQRADRTGYSEDELDNQDPHDKHAERTLDEQPQELNTSARVGEGLKTGTHLALEQADVPLKPHDGEMETQGEDRDERQNR